MWFVQNKKEIKLDAKNKIMDIPKTMKAWVLGDPDNLTLVEKPVPEPGPAEVLVRIDAIAVCATDLEIIHHLSDEWFKKIISHTVVSR